MVSAYGTVGLSLGIPTVCVPCILCHLVLKDRPPQANYSFSGALYTGSKLLLCAVMLRGRHRGLPMSLDRATMLPHEFDKEDNSPAGGADMGTAEVLRSPTKNSVKPSQEPGEHIQVETIEKC